MMHPTPISTHIALTGTIASGKSTITSLLRHWRIPVFCADEATHTLLTTDRIITRIQQRHPHAVAHGQILRSELGRIVFAHPQERIWLESLLHPAIATMERYFVRRHAASHTLLVSDIPLLMEAGNKQKYDAIWLAFCLPHTYIKRALARPQMTPEKLNNILHVQRNTLYKRHFADACIPTSLGMACTRQHLLTLLRSYGVHPHA